MLYTGKGDDGTTETFGGRSQMSKASARAEALGTVDELNSFLGVCKIKADEVGIRIGAVGDSVAKIIHLIQKDLFIVQAELGGADKRITDEKVDRLEEWIDEIDEELPPINSFKVPGGTELAAQLDTARAIARRTERRIVGAHGQSPEGLVGDPTLAFINRLSSLLYACARLVNRKSGVMEDRPDYE